MDVITVKNKTKKYDFVFVCESKVRELECCCLIGLELEKRGYKVGIINYWMPLIRKDYEPVETKVLMSHAIYKDESLKRELSYIKGTTKVINMQWEQIYSKRELTSKLSPWKMEGDVKKAIHLSWGQNNYDKLVDDDGVPKENVRMVGSVTMDFLRPEYRDYYLSRDEVIKSYNLPSDKKLCLFISSFSLVNLPANIQEDEFKDIWDLQIESQKKVLSWFDKILDTRDDITLVYRPHPAEADNVLLSEMEKKHKNFVCIRELSVKQWIIVADVIYNWFSTAMAEIYFANKQCFILRPMPLSDDIEVTILENGKFITTLDEFEHTFDATEIEMPIPEENISSSYCNKKETPVFLEIAKICEEIIDGNSESFIATDRYTLKDRCLYKLKNTFLGKLLLKLKHRYESTLTKTETDLKNEDYEMYVNEMFLNNDFTQEEVDYINNRLKSVMC